MGAARLKVIFSAAILMAGLALTILAVSSETTETSSGIVIDFGDGDTIYTYVDFDSFTDPIAALESACSSQDLELEIVDGKVQRIASVENDGKASWTFFEVQAGEDEWSHVDDLSSVEMGMATISCWGFCADGSVPSPAVDVTGHSIYGITVPKRVITIAPSCTETVCAAGGTDLIIGTDIYSNYPMEIVDGRASGSIAEVGGFTNPSYESILKEDPDLVVCIGSQNSHLQLASKLRSNGVDVVVMSGGEDVTTVLDNLFMAGVVLGTQTETNDLISELQTQMAQVQEEISDGEGVWNKRVMVSLSAMKSPWVSGSDTYISDIMSGIMVTNIYSGESGWVQVNAETILKNDPEYIVVVSSDYSATQGDYDSMLASMSSEWRGTSAYKNGNIFLLTDDAADLASRPGPRVAQITELFARILQGSAFDDGISIPKFIGDEYRDYLTFSKEGSI